jgi:hypothetical protein
MEEEELLRPMFPGGMNLVQREELKAHQSDLTRVKSDRQGD